MSSQSQMLLIEFHGRIDKYTFGVTAISDIPRPGQQEVPYPNSEVPERPTTLNELIFQLNNRTEEIAEAIRFELSRALPPSVTVYSQISFFEGSISWSGIITVVDWMDRIGGTIGFLEVIVKVSKFAVEKVMQHWFSYHQPQLGLNLKEPIQVEVNSYSETNTQNPSPHDAGNNNDLRYLMFVVGANTILLLAILVIQLIS